VHGQIQYGYVQSTTTVTTPRALHVPAVGGRRRAAKSLMFVTLVIAAVVLLLALPGQTPVTVPTMMLGGVWLLVVLAISLPSPSERASEEASKQLARFRHALNAIGDAPTRAQLEAMLGLARELLPNDPDIKDDITRIHGSLAALALGEDIAAGRLPVVPTVSALPPGASCHFQSAVRIDRRVSDHDQQYGRLLMTTGWLTFRGPSDLSIAWSEVSGVQRAGADLLMTVADSRHVVRFSFHSVDEAARAGVIANHLRQVAVT